MIGVTGEDCFRFRGVRPDSVDFIFSYRCGEDSVVYLSAGLLLFDEPVMRLGRSCEVYRLLGMLSLSIQDFRRFGRLISTSTRCLTLVRFVCCRISLLQQS